MLDKKFIIKYFDAQLNDWQTLEKSSPTAVSEEIARIGQIPWQQLFVFEIEEERVLRKWRIGLIEEEDFND